MRVGAIVYLHWELSSEADDVIYWKFKSFNTTPADVSRTCSGRQSIRHNVWNYINISRSPHLSFGEYSPLYYFFFLRFAARKCCVCFAVVFISSDRQTGIFSFLTSTSAQQWIAAAAHSIFQWRWASMWSPRNLIELARADYCSLTSHIVCVHSGWIRHLIGSRQALSKRRARAFFRSFKFYSKWPELSICISRSEVELR